MWGTTYRGVIHAQEWHNEYYTGYTHSNVSLWRLLLWSKRRKASNAVTRSRGRSFLQEWTHNRTSRRGTALAHNQQKPFLLLTQLYLCQAFSTKSRYAYNRCLSVLECWPVRIQNTSELELLLSVKGFGTNGKVAERLRCMIRKQVRQSVLLSCYALPCFKLHNLWSYRHRHGYIKSVHVLTRMIAI